jgi:hypothetical protein
MDLGGYMLIKNNQLSYEEYEGGMTMVQINYNYDGVMSEMFMYSDYMHQLVKVDLEHFEQRHPTMYAYFQQRINDAVNNNYKEYL